MPHFFSSFFHTQHITRCATERKNQKKITRQTSEKPKTKKKESQWLVGESLAFYNLNNPNS
jgi:hypothetical protein